MTLIQVFRGKEMQQKCGRWIVWSSVEARDRLRNRWKSSFETDIETVCTVLVSGTVASRVKERQIFPFNFVLQENDVTTLSPRAYKRAACLQRQGDRWTERRQPTRGGKI